MVKSSWSRTLAWVSLAGALTGCSTVPDQPQSAEPPPMNTPDTAGSDEPVPKVESPSRTGNPDTYVVFGRRYRVKETSEGYREEGTASWYGWEFHGRKTSSGPLFNMFELTAAHKSLPLPSYVQVTNLENGRHIVVKITDRGPFVGERLIDLSYAAAERLGMLEQGTARVEISALAPYQFLPTLAARRTELREMLANRQQQPEPVVKPAVIQFARATPARPSAQEPGKPPAQVLARIEREREKARLLAQAQVQAKSARLAQASAERDKLVKASAQPPMRLASAYTERDKAKSQAQAPARPAQTMADRVLPKTMAKTADAKGTGLKLADVKAPAKAESDRKAPPAALRLAAVAPPPKAKEVKAKEVVEDRRVRSQSVATVGKKPEAAQTQNIAGRSDVRPQARNDAATGSGKQNAPAGVIARTEPRSTADSKATALRLASVRMNRPRIAAD